MLFSDKKIVKYLYFQILLLSISIFFAQNAYNQIKKIGTPIVVNYPKKIYNAGTQTWSIAQQSNGILYFANNQGVLQYDGTFWNLYPIPNGSVARSVAVDKNDIIYVGASDEFGYLKPNEKGILTYYSLSQKLAPEFINFDEVWKIYPTTEGVYFQSYTALFLYKNKQLHTLLQNANIDFSYYVNDTLFIRNIKNNNLIAFKGTQYIEKQLNNWDKNQKIWSFLPFNNKKYLLAGEKGLYFLEGENVVDWDIPFKDTLVKNRVFSSLKINNDTYLFGTVLNGVYIINSKGEIIQHINRQKTLQNNTVLSVFVDSYKKLWLGLDNGISEIDIASPFTFFNEGANLHGTGYAAQIYNNYLYFGTNQGVQYANWKFGNIKFKMLDSLKGQVWFLEEIDKKLYCGHNEGLFVIDENNTVQKISNENGSWNFSKIPKVKNLALSGTYTGIVILKKNAKGIWTFSHKLKGFDYSSRTIIFDKDNSIWVSHGYKGIFHLKTDTAFTKVININFYDKTKGLPDNYANTLFKLSDEITTSTTNGIYIYNSQKDIFEKSKKWNQFFNNKIAYIPFKDKNQNVWFNYSSKFVKLEQKKDGKYTLNDDFFNPFQYTLVNGFDYLYLFDNENVFFGVENGFLHYNNKKFENKQHFPTFIRKVIFTNAYDSVLYDLSLLKKEFLESQKFVFAHKSNSIKFLFSAPFFDGNPNIQYKFYLENYDKEWSDWIMNNQKEYTNLEAGKYIFKVKARNIYNIESQEASFNFIISPPWYQSFLAIAIYLILAIFFVIILATYIVRRMEKEKLRLREKQKEELLMKEKAYKEQNILTEREIIKLKNEKLNAEIERKNIEFDLKKKELASVAFQITHKNEILSQVRDSLIGISEKVNFEAQKHLRKLIKSIEDETKIDEDWEQFKKHFEQVHGEFFTRLKTNYPDLTPKDLKMCAYLRINLTTKEIAPLMNISVRGVEISRYRLRKKLNLDNNANLIDFMMNV
jgi:ligand-binding sensor domain-containing protein/DNA-binding CsgD family transcriptional regulator